jgi:hypothetical protein
MLNCGLTRDRGMLRISTRRVTPNAWRISMSSSAERVECPTVYRVRRSARILGADVGNSGSRQESGVCMGPSAGVETIDEPAPTDAAE